MAKQKWDRTEKLKGWGRCLPDWRLRAEFCHPQVFVYAEHTGYSGRKHTPRYRVRVVGPLAAVVLVYKSGLECWWTLDTAKRKAESVAYYTAWLEKYGVIEGEEDVN